MPKVTDRAQAGAALQRLLEAVERGEIDADTPQAKRLLRRLEGAVAAWDEKPPAHGRNVGNR